MSSSGSKNIYIYRKAAELQTMSRAIVSCIASRDDALLMYKSNSLREQVAGSLLTDTALLRKEIVLAASTTSVSMRQNSLQLVQIMIRNLNSYCRGLEMDGVREREYLELLRQELKGFRRAFKQWRKSLGY